MQLKRDFQMPTWFTIHGKMIMIKIMIISDFEIVQGGSNMTGTDLYVKKPHCAAAVRP